MKPSMRKWHNWLGAVLGLPLLLVGLTCVFIAHKDALGTEDIRLPVARTSERKLEIRSSARIGDEQWIGTPLGVFRLDGLSAEQVAGSPKDEIRAMVVAGDGVLLAGKKALWRLENGKATPVYKADCWHVAADLDGFVATFKDKGLMASKDGQLWSPQAIDFPPPVIAALDQGRPLSKIIMDLHTGKLFFGKRYEWIWIDAIGLACAGLGLSGLVIWMRGRRQRAGRKP